MSTSARDSYPKRLEFIPFQIFFGYVWGFDLWALYGHTATHMIISVTRRVDFVQPHDPVHIIGFCVIGLVSLGLACWMLNHFYKIKIRPNAVDREAVVRRSGITLLPIRGLDDEKEEYVKLQIRRNAFSPERERKNSCIVLPERALSRPSRLPAYNNREVIDHRRCNMTSKNASFSQNTPSDFPSPTASLGTSTAHDSATNTITFASSMPSNASSIIPLCTPPRKVRQTFEPVLPDELTIQVGEKLSLVRSFEDGWCLVGHHSCPNAATRKLVVKTGPSSDLGDDDTRSSFEGVVFGVVPGWCFVRPAPGLTPMPPLRNVSLSWTGHLAL